MVSSKKAASDAKKVDYLKDRKAMADSSDAAGAVREHLADFLVQPEACFGPFLPRVMYLSIVNDKSKVLDTVYS